MKKELFNYGLPKWPALLVKGEKITKQQAMEIIIRTDDIIRLSSNDKDFENQICKITLGVECKRYGDEDRNIAIKLGLDPDKWNDAVWNYKEEKAKLVKPLELEYLNNRQILSNWIGGAHGWCDWNGNIHTNNYNIGEYPSVEEVYKEWVMIAKEFPFLNLRCQLLSGETCEPNTSPVVEFVVKNGEVSLIEPNETLSGTVDVDFRINDYGRERGCTIEQFKESYNFCLNKFSQLT